MHLPWRSNVRTVKLKLQDGREVERDLTILALSDNSNTVVSACPRDRVETNTVYSTAYIAYILTQTSKHWSANILSTYLDKLGQIIDLQT